MNLQEILEKIKHIPSNVVDEDTTMHVKYLSNLPDVPLILDFGTGWGKIAISMALACPQAEIVTFDPGTPYQNYEEIVRKYLKPYKNIRFSINDSHEVIWIERIDVLSIDASHTYEDTKFEIEKFYPFVKPGGLILMHDYVVERVDVKKAVDEYLLEHPEYEILESAGYTTIIKKL